MSRRLSGINPLAYIGVEPTAPPLLRVERRAPTVNDLQNVNIGTIWLNELTNTIYMLVSLSGSVATWAQIFPAINAGAITFHGDTGTAVPASNIITMAGGRNLTSHASGSTVTLDLDDNVTIAGPLTITSLTDGVISSVLGELVGSAGTNGQVMIGETGGDPIWANLTAGANVTITNGPNSITIASSGGGGAGDVTVVTDSGSAVSLAGSINFTAGSNIATHATAAHTFVANLVDSPTVSGTVTAGTGFIAVNGNVTIQSGNVELPHTSADESEGEIRFAGNRWISDYGSRNTFIGESSGNTTLDVPQATDNTGVGFSALNLLTLGEANTAFGDVTLSFLTEGDGNCAFGNSSLIGLVTGSNNIAVGNISGSNYAGAESNNILIGSQGILGESNVLRIGRQGSGSGQQQDTYIAGVYTPNTPLNATFKLASVDLNGKVGGLANGTNGQLLIGSTGGSPAWANITAGANISINNSSHGITIAAVGGGGGGGITTIHTGSGDGSEDPADTSITLSGSGPITTSAVNHTVTVGMTNAANGYLLIAGGAGPIWAPLVSSNASIAITNTANHIDLTVAGAGGTGSFHSDSGTAAPAAGIINVVGGYNISTSAAGSTVTVQTKDALDVPTTVNNAAGTYKINNQRFVHAYGTNNTFLGALSGNFTLTTGSATSNTGVGRANLGSLTTGANNTSLGYFALNQLTTGSSNTAIGYQSMDSATTAIANTALGWNALQGITTGQSNIAIGSNAGANLTTTNSSNILIGNTGSSGLTNTIRIGVTGTSGGQQSVCQIAGIRPTTFTSGSGIVLCSSTDRLQLLNNGNTVAGQIVMFDGLNVPTAGNIISSDSFVNVVKNSPNGNIDLKANGVKWYAYQTGTGASVTGSNEEHFLGTGASYTWTKIFDTHNIVNASLTGAATPLSITIPRTGTYYVSVQMTIGRYVPPPPPPPPPTPARIDPLYVYVNGVRRWIYYTPPGLNQSSIEPRTFPWSIFATFVAGDVITFSVQVDLTPAATVLSPLGTNALPGYPTYISGFFVP